jgi:beta-lactamase regulating signal transducer with metallopeptidase domain
MSALALSWPTDWIGETLVASALLIVAVLILRRPAARLVGPRAAYLLWAVPALRLLLPPIPEASLGPVSFVDLSVLAPQAAEALPLPPAAASAAAFDWAFALGLVWLAGAVLHMAWHVARYRRFIRGVVGAQPPEHVVSGIGVHSADVAGPAAAGIVRRLILLPYDFADRFDPRERRLALAHEVAHHRRGDLIANWVALAVLSLHWFNPLAHIAYRAFRADQELACDATVLGAASESERHAYASAVVKAAWAKSPVAACPMNSAGQLKTRLTMMRTGAIQRPLAGLATVAVIAAAALGATASRTAALPALAPAPAAFGALAALERTIDAAPGPAAADPAPVSAEALAVPAPAATPAEPRPATATPSSAPEGAPALAVTLPPLAAAEVRPEPVTVIPVEPRAAPDLSAVFAARPVAPSTPDAVLPSAEVLKSEAALARKELASLSRGVLGVSNVRAVMVDGRFNAAEPGVAFAGFCGRVLLDGEIEAVPFFVSTTPSRPGHGAKCAGPQSAEDYSRYFEPPRVRRASPAVSRGGCRADTGSCSMRFAGLTSRAMGSELAAGVVR